MKIDNFDCKQKVFIIAEIGNNHEGSIDLAEKLLELAAVSGADAVKFQTFKTEHYVSSENQAQFKRLKKFELKFSDFERLAKLAQRKGVLFLSTPFDIESADFLNSLVPAFKVSSSDLNFNPLLRKLAKFRKPIILSTGLSEREYISQAIATLKGEWGLNAPHPNLALLHCVSSYPVPLEQANLAALFEMKKSFEGLTIGYSDHTLGTDVASLAVSAGARIIEKHFTCDKNFSDFRDHQLSAEPQEFLAMVKRIREIEIILGKEEKLILPCEEPLKIVLKRSIASTRALGIGHKVSSSDITWVRPGTGILCGNENKIIGRILKQTVEPGALFNESMFG